MKRIVMVLGVALIMAAMMVVSAMPAFADKTEVDVDVTVGNSGNGNNDCNGVTIETGNKDKCNQGGRHDSSLL